MLTKLVPWFYSQSQSKYQNVYLLKLSQHDNFYLLVGFELNQFLVFITFHLYTCSFFIGT